MNTIHISFFFVFWIDNGNLYCFLRICHEQNTKTFPCEVEKLMFQQNDDQFRLVDSSNDVDLVDKTWKYELVYPLKVAERKTN